MQFGARGSTQVHEFISRDNSHPSFNKIKGSFLISTMERLKVAGYVLWTIYVLHDRRGREHSEKLAVAFALISIEDHQDHEESSDLSGLSLSLACSTEILSFGDENLFHYFSKGSCW